MNFWLVNAAFARNGSFSWRWWWWNGFSSHGRLFVVIFLRNVFVLVCRVFNYFHNHNLLLNFLDLNLRHDANFFHLNRRFFFHSGFFIFTATSFLREHKPVPILHNMFILWNLWLLLRDVCYLCHFSDISNFSGEICLLSFQKWILARSGDRLFLSLFDNNHLLLATSSQLLRLTLMKFKVKAVGVRLHPVEYRVCWSLTRVLRHLLLLLFGLFGLVVICRIINIGARLLCLLRFRRRIVINTPQRLLLRVHHNLVNVCLRF